MQRIVLQALLGAIGFLLFIWFLVYTIIWIIRTAKMALSKEELKACQRCGKLSTEKLIEVQGDAFNMFVCKNCRAIIKRRSHIVWITVAGCIVTWALFMCYCYRFPVQIENIFNFFEKLLSSK